MAKILDRIFGNRKKLAEKEEEAAALPTQKTKVNEAGGSKPDVRTLGAGASPSGSYGDEESSREQPIGPENIRNPYVRKYFQEDIDEIGGARVRDRKRREDEAKAQAELAKKTRNAAREAEYRGRGQKFYTDAFGDLQPVIEEGTRKPLYTETQWETERTPEGNFVDRRRTRHGEVMEREGVPNLETRDDAPDELFYDGASLGKVHELAEHPNRHVRQTAQERLKQNRAKVYEASVGEYDKRIAEAQLREQELASEEQKTQEFLLQRSNQGMPAGDLEEKLAALQTKREGIKAEVDHLTAQKKVWQNKKTVDGFERLADRRRAAIASRGGNPDEDQVLQTILRKQQELGVEDEKLTRQEQQAQARAESLKVTEQKAEEFYRQPENRPTEERMAEREREIKERRAALDTKASDLDQVGETLSAEIGALEKEMNAAQDPATRKALESEIQSKVQEFRGQQEAYQQESAAFNEGIADYAGAVAVWNDHVAPELLRQEQMERRTRLQPAKRVLALRGMSRQQREELEGRRKEIVGRGSGMIGADVANVLFPEQTSYETEPQKELAKFMEQFPREERIEILRDAKKLDWRVNETPFEVLSTGDVEPNPRLADVPPAEFAKIVSEEQKAGKLTEAQAERAIETHTRAQETRDLAMLDLYQDFPAFDKFAKANGGKKDLESFRAWMATEPSFLSEKLPAAGKEALKQAAAWPGAQGLGVGILTEGYTGKGDWLTHAATNYVDWIEKVSGTSDPRMEGDLVVTAGGTAGQLGAQVTQAILTKSLATALLAAAPSTGGSTAPAAIAAFTVDSVLMGLAQGADSYRAVREEMERAGGYTEDEIEARAMKAFMESSVALGALERAPVELLTRNVFGKMSSTRVGRIMTILADAGIESGQEFVSQEVANAINSEALDTYTKPERMTGEEMLGVAIGAGGVGAVGTGIRSELLDREQIRLQNAEQEALKGLKQLEAEEYSPTRYVMPGMSEDERMAAAELHTGSMNPDITETAESLLPVSAEAEAQTIHARLEEISPQLADARKSKGLLQGVDAEGRNTLQREATELMQRKKVLAEGAKMRMLAAQDLMDPAVFEPETEVPLARALMKLGQGGTLEELTTAEGYAVANATDGKGLPYVDQNDASGETIITDAGMNWLKERSRPAAALIKGGSESEQIRQILKERAAAQEAPEDQGEAQEPSTQNQGRQGTVSGQKSVQEQVTFTPAQVDTPALARDIAVPGLALVSRNAGLRATIERISGKNAELAVRQVSTAFAKEAKRYEPVFRVVSRQMKARESGGATTGLDRSLNLNLGDIFDPVNLETYFGDEKRIGKIIEEEAIHSLGLEVLGEEGAGELWRLASDSAKAEVLKLRDDVAGNDVMAGSELFRLFVQGKLDKILTEATDRSLLAKLRTVFERLLELLSDSKNFLQDAEAAARVDAMASDVAARIKTLREADVADVNAEESGPEFVSRIATAIGQKANEARFQFLSEDGKKRELRAFNKLIDMVRPALAKHREAFSGVSVDDTLPENWKFAKDMLFWADDKGTLHIFVNNLIARAGDGLEESRVETMIRREAERVSEPEKKAPAAKKESAPPKPAPARERGQDALATGNAVTRGSNVHKNTLPKTRDGVEDLLWQIADSGGIYLPAQGERGNEYNSLPDEFHKWGPAYVSSLFRKDDLAKRSLMPDQVATVHGFDTASELFEAMERAYKARQEGQTGGKTQDDVLEAQGREEERTQKAKAKQFRKDAKTRDPGETIIQPSRLSVGDKFTVEGEPVEVIGVVPAGNGKPEMVQLEDGSVYGFVEINGDGKALYVRDFETEDGMTAEDLDLETVPEKGKAKPKPEPQAKVEPEPDAGRGQDALATGDAGTRSATGEVKSAPKSGASQELLDEGREAFEGLFSKRGGAGAGYTSPLPRDRVAAMQNLASRMVGEGIKTPEALAKYLDDVSGGKEAVRQYSQNLWAIVKAFGGEGAWEPDWKAVWEPEAQAEPKPEPKPEKVVETPEAAEELPLFAEAKPVADQGLAAAQALAERLQEVMREDGGKITANELNEIVGQFYGGTLASGAFTSKDAYDALELGINLLLMRDRATRAPHENREQALGVVERIRELLAKIPTQTRRTKEQDDLQQFSTPPHLAYAANWVARLRQRDVYFEPSAGMGGLAFWGQKSAMQFGDMQVFANEWSKRRADLLKASGIADTVFTENAMQAHAIFDAKIKSGAMARPTVVVMNPPFSNDEESGIKRQSAVGARHVEEALKVLEDGGRLVAIVGRGMGFYDPVVKAWWARIQRTYDVRANVLMPGKEYQKYGTTFANRLLVIDKQKPSGRVPVAVEVEKLEELFTLLEGVRNERPVPKSPAQQSGKRAPEPSGDKSGNGADGNRASDRGNVPVGGTKPDQGGMAGRSAIDGQPQNPGSAAGSGNQPARREGRQPAGLAGDAGAGSGTAVTAPATQSASAVTVEKKERKQPAKEDDAGIFAEYEPAKVNIPGAQPHPAPLVESAAMAAVAPPDPVYQPDLPDYIIKEGRLSDVQLENVIYAGQAHATMLPNGERKGYFIGDGTGVGKGRQIAGIILDNWRQGRKRAIWISKNNQLAKDARRDLADLLSAKHAGETPGLTEQSLVPMKDAVKSKAGEGAKGIAMREGIMFVGYDTLKSNHDGIDGDGNLRSGKQKSRIQQLVDWLGRDFDGVIAFDEAHKAGNAISLPGKRGIKAASKTGMAVVDLQKIFPKARIVYVSATGASSVENLAYAERLGIWGDGRTFTDVRDFISKITAGGVSVMEVVARDLKALGLYLARSISYKGVEFNRVTHVLTPGQNTMYDEMARAWQTVFQNMNEALKITQMGNNAQARSNAASQFWGSQQRFFNQFLTALQVPSVVEDMEKQLEAGRSILLQLVNTNEATQERAVKKKMAEEGADLDLDDLDLSPRDILLSYVDKAFPTVAYKEVMNPNDPEKTSWVPVTDSAGNMIEDPEAVRMKMELMDKIALMQVPDNPMEMILNKFGAENISEITGRNRRVVKQQQQDGSIKTVLESRGVAKRQKEAQEFQDGKRRILIFSEAGGTGFSFHADKRAKNQEQRVHYVLQAGWRADNVLQGLGRSHRSNQKQPPFYKLVETNLKGHKRFISTIAKRLEELGALTSGERKSTGQGLFTELDNLESQYAQDALFALVDQIVRGNEDRWGLQEFSEKMGFVTTAVNSETGEIELKSQLKGPDGTPNVGAYPNISRFMNRILALELNDQNDLFERFMDRFEASIEAAKAAGSYDPGTQSIQAAEIRKVEDDTVYTHPETGAVTRLVDVEIDEAVSFQDFDDVKRLSREMKNPFWAENTKSGYVSLLAERLGGRTIVETGEVVPQYRRFTVRGKSSIDRADVRFEGEKANYRRLESEGEARKLWEAQIAEAEKVTTRKETFVVGVMLPIWDRLRIPRPLIYRFTVKDGESLLGVNVPAMLVPDVKMRLGANVNIEPEAVFDMLMAKKELMLANDWVIRQVRVANEPRLEVITDDMRARSELTDYMGAFMERIDFRPRIFIPTDRAKGTATLRKILNKSPIAMIDGNPLTGKPEVKSRRAEDGHLDDAGKAVLRAEIEELLDQIERETALMPDLGRVGAAQLKASTEKAPDKTTGRPDLANPFEGERTRNFVHGLDQARSDAEIPDKISHEEMRKEAERVLRDPDAYNAAKRDLLRQARRQGVIDASMTFMAQQIAEEEIRRAFESGSHTQRREAQIIVNAYRQTGTEVARALGARRDPFKTPQQRHREFLGRVLFTPPPDVRQQLEEARDAAERERILKEDYEGRVRRIEGALDAMGLSLSDLMSGHVTVTLDKHEILTRWLDENLGKRERKAFQMFQQGASYTAIAKKTGINADALDGYLRAFKADFRKRYGRLIQKRGLTADQLTSKKPIGELKSRKAHDDQGLEAALNQMFEEFGVERTERTGGTRKTPDAPRKPNLADPGQVAKVARTAQQLSSDLHDKLFEWWINSILSGPTTHAVNIAGNVLNAGSDILIYRSFEALMNEALGAVSGGKLLATEGARIGEFGHLMKGLGPGMARGWHNAKRAFKAETSVFRTDVLEEEVSFEEDEKHGSYRVAIRGGKGKVIRVPGRLLLFMDELAKGITGQMYAGAFAYRMAKEEGLTGDDMSERIAELVSQPGSEAWIRSVEKAEELTFQTELRTRVKGGGRAENLAAWFTTFRSQNRILRWFFPFIRTPFNIFRQGLSKSPMGTALLAHAALSKMTGNKLPGLKSKWRQARLNRALAEQMIAWTLTSVLYHLAATEGDEDDEDKPFLITGSGKGPAYSKRQQEYRLGVAPFTIKIGDKSFSYGRVEPLATILGVTVDTISAIKQIQNGEERSKALGGLMGAVVNQVHEKTFARGLDSIVGFFEAPVSDKGRVATDWGSDFLASFVPNLIRQPIRESDVYVRESSVESADDLLARFMERAGEKALPVGALREKKIDAFGREIKKGGNSQGVIGAVAGALFRTFSPVRVDDVPEIQRADLLLWNYQQKVPGESVWAPGTPSRVWKNPRNGESFRLNDADYREYQERVGRYARANLAKITMRQVENPTEEDVRVVQREFEKARRRAKAEMLQRVSRETVAN